MISAGVPAVWINLLAYLETSGLRWRKAAYLHKNSNMPRFFRLALPTLPSPPCPALPCLALLLPTRRYQLYWAMVGSAALFVVQDVVLLVLVATSDGQVVSKPALAAYIFFADLAMGYWLGILLLVAAGYW